MDTRIPRRKNPSREICEQIIGRILSAEIQEHGSNYHFKQAADFMSYFESLYPASDSLTKQVQRAIKAMNMPRNEEGFFIPNKTALQLEQEKLLRSLLHQPDSCLDSLDDCETLFLRLEPALCDYAVHIIAQCDTFRNTYVTIQRTCEGLIFYTRTKKQLSDLLENILK